MALDYWLWVLFVYFFIFSPLRLVFRGYRRMQSVKPASEPRLSRPHPAPSNKVRPTHNKAALSQGLIGETKAIKPYPFEPEGFKESVSTLEASSRSLKQAKPSEEASKSSSEPIDGNENWSKAVVMSELLGPPRALSQGLFLRPSQKKSP